MANTALSTGKLANWAPLENLAIALTLAGTTGCGDAGDRGGRLLALLATLSGVRVRCGDRRAADVEAAEAVGEGRPEVEGREGERLDLDLDLDVEGERAGAEREADVAAMALNR